MRPAEIIFEVTEGPEGGYDARALGHSIFTQEDWNDLKAMARDAVLCQFDEDNVPPSAQGRVAPAFPTAGRFRRMEAQGSADAIVSRFVCEPWLFARRLRRCGSPALLHRGQGTPRCAPRVAQGR